MRNKKYLKLISMFVKANTQLQISLIKFVRYVCNTMIHSNNFSVNLYKHKRKNQLPC